MALAGGLFVSLLWQNFIYLDEFASKDALSERVQKVHGLITFLLLAQVGLSLALVLVLEWVIAKKRKAKGAIQCDAANRR